MSSTPRQPQHLVVVGASLAGVRAVESARKTGFAGRITLIGSEPHVPYDRPPLSKAVLIDDPAPEAPLLRLESFLRDDLATDLRLSSTASALDTDERIVVVGGDEVRFDALVVATGATARTLPGSAIDGVHTLRTLDDARSVRRALDAGARTVVIGAGFIGSEVASAARKRDLAVTVVEAMPTPLARAVGVELGAACASIHQRNGTDLRCGVGVTDIEGRQSVERVRLSDGTCLEADLVVVGIGARPETDWLRSSSLALEDGVVCDEHMETAVPGIFAAGDVARWRNGLFERVMRVEHWTNAAEQGTVAGRNAVDGTGEPEPYETVPYFWSDLYGSRIQFVGVVGDTFEVVSGDLASDHFVALYRDGERLVGALTLNGQRHIMKYRRLIGMRASYSDGTTLAHHLSSETR